MNRIYGLYIFWCISMSLVRPNDAVNIDMLSLCSEIVDEEGQNALDCRNKNYQNIPVNLFQLKNKRIYLSGNPYICDCGMVWYVEGLLNKSVTVKIVDADLMTCALPDNMKGKFIKDFTKNDICQKRKSCYNLNCSKHASCVTNSGSESEKCVCKPGFTGDGFLCEDINECSQGSYDCDMHQDCHNTLGSFECRCKSGLENDNEDRCKAPEPCEAVFRACDTITSFCVDKKRGYECSCLKGFHKKPGKKSCTDVDECKLKNGCSKHARCFNKIGSYTCVCKEGYAGNGKVCEDVDECATGSHRCPKETVCVNSKDGGYNCHCRPGYILAEDKTTCEREKKELMPKKIIVLGGAVAILLIIFTICCCCCCCCRRKNKKSKKGSKEKLVGDQALKANKDLMNMAVEPDPFLLQQQNQLQQQMYMFNMQPQTDQYMTYFGGDETVVQTKGVQPHESTMTSWSDEDEYVDYYEDIYN